MLRCHFEAEIQYYTVADSSICISLLRRCIGICTRGPPLLSFASGVCWLVKILTFCDASILERGE